MISRSRWAGPAATVAGVAVAAAAIDLGAKAVAEAWLEEGAVRGALPFVDLSREKDQDYLCEGLAEEILTLADEPMPDHL